MKKKHSFGFLYKYLFLAAALMAVLCFCCVFARFTTGATEKVTANIDGFVLSSYVYEDMGKNVYYEKEHASGVVVGNDKDEYLMVLVVVNECDFPVSCEIKMGEGYMITEAVTYTGCFEPSGYGEGYKVSPDSIDGTTIYSSSTDIPKDAESVAVTDENEEVVVGLKSTPFGNVAAYKVKENFPFLTLVFTVEKNITEYDGDTVQTIPGLKDTDTYHGYWHSFDFTVYYAQTGEVD